ncbi:MAG TPA: PepSY domain-containing protein [Caulobacteraceae bacterium]|nr:PepSY domain-containing protein [Caulobacteraceae bacterium]
MQRTLPGLVGAILAASLFAAGGGVAQPVNKPPPSVQPRPHPNSLGADWRLQQDEARQGVREHHLMPLGRVIEQVRMRTPGRQLDAGLEYQGERPIYRVRWMTRDGRRIDYLIDAATGVILSGN